MGFFSSLVYYRPTPPPIIRSPSLLKFVQRFADCGAADEKSALGCSLQVKYGDAVDQDDSPATWEEPIDYGTKPTWLQRLATLLGFRPRAESSVSICTEEEIDWDCLEQYDTLTELAEGIGGLDPKQNVYRAEIILGTATDSVIRAMERVDSPENEIDLLLTDWMLQVGPIEIFDLATEQPYHVGWIGLSLGGDGYLFPWTLKDLVKRAEACPEVRSVANVCRDLWPISPELPSQERMQNRRTLGDLWPDPIDAPVDWAWGVEETG